MSGTKGTQMSNLVLKTSKAQIAVVLCLLSSQGRSHPSYLMFLLNVSIQIIRFTQTCQRPGFNALCRKVTRSPVAATVGYRY